MKPAFLPAFFQKEPLCRVRNADEDGAAESGQRPLQHGQCAGRLRGCPGFGDRQDKHRIVRFLPRLLPEIPQERGHCFRVRRLSGFRVRRLSGKEHLRQSAARLFVLFIPVRPADPVEEDLIPQV